MSVIVITITIRVPIDRPDRLGKLHHRARKHLLVGIPPRLRWRWWRDFIPILVHNHRPILVDLFRQLRIRVRHEIGCIVAVDLPDFELDLALCKDIRVIVGELFHALQTVSAT